MSRFLQPTSLRHRPLANLAVAMADKHYKDLRCTLCGHQWIGNTTTCPSCNGVAKSDGEVTKKTFDEPDLKKGLR
jgi:rubrerythrin